MAKRTPLIAGNWKMNKTVQESVETAQALIPLISDVTGREILIAPPFTSLAMVAQTVKGSLINVGAQNIFWEKSGAFTGEIAGNMLVSAGCSYVIIGHSERRQYFGETDETVNKRIKATLSVQLIPLVCIGETEQERESQKTFSVLDTQIVNGLKNFSMDDLCKLVIAYEPVWAIGTGKTATENQVQEVHEYIRKFLTKQYSASVSDTVRILYGGSVKADNIDRIMALPDVDGVLVGGASLDVKGFNRIIHFN
ncbi:MAG: triose-phosphate isomerase [Desulfobacterales bacterium]|nr:triose-phosphate isomerase [Desulfobacterales bacterium]